MVKRALEDIIPKNGKRRLPVISHREPEGRSAREEREEKKVEKKKPSPPPSRPPEPPREFRFPLKRPRMLYVVAFICFAVFLFSLSLFFVGANVVIYPKHRTMFFQKTALASKSGVTPLHFEMLEVSHKESMGATATGEREVKRKASGVIIVYNAYNQSPQKLIKNTRFETPDGKIYRIDASITVPGMQEEEGKLLPGSVEATVYADEPGEEYNIGKTDFTLPGFKGGPRYSKFYARSKTDMKGGMIGNVYTISEADADEATAILERRLGEILLGEIKKNVPPEFVLYEDGVFFDFGDLKTVGSEGAKTVTVELEGSVHALLWNREALAKFIAQNGIDGFDGAPVESPTLDSLRMVIKDKDLLDHRSLRNITITLSGTTTIVWSLNEEALLSELSGKPKKNFQAVLSRYPSIDRAELSVTPFWARSLPEKASDIHLVKQLPDQI